MRALEGALIRVVAFGSLTGRPVTAELADEVLAGLYPDLQGAPARDDRRARSRSSTADAFGISVDALVSSSRAGAVAWPRQVAMYLARELTDQTLPAIGRAFGGRNHTTVLHACRRTAERIADDPDAYETVRRLTEILARRRDAAPADRLLRSCAHAPHSSQARSLRRSPAVMHTIHTLMTVTSP